MDLGEFDQIASSSDWNILVWDKLHAYKINGRAVDKSYFDIEALDGGNWKRVTTQNCDDFQVKFSGEMQAAFQFIRKEIMRELSYKLGGNL